MQPTGGNAAGRGYGWAWYGRRGLAGGRRSSKSGWHSSSPWWPLSDTDQLIWCVMNALAWQHGKQLIIGESARAISTGVSISFSVPNTADATPLIGQACCHHYGDGCMRLP